MPWRWCGTYPELWRQVTEAAVELGLAADAVAVAERLAHYVDHPVGALPGALAREHLPGGEPARQRLSKIVEQYPGTPRTEGGR
jgi:hypothetical protein